MNCHDVENLVLAAPSAPLPQAAQEHLASCSSCRALFSSGPNLAPPLDPALLARLHQALPARLAPVRRLASTPVLTALFFAVFAAASVLGVARFGAAGYFALTPWQRVPVFAIIAGLSLFASFAAARAMRPGARSFSGAALLVTGVALLEFLFFAILRDYNTAGFFKIGLTCCRYGFSCAVPAAILAWLILRRGFVVGPVSAGAAIGAVAGLAGLCAQEMYCPVVTIPHVAVWHTALFAVSLSAGALLGWLSGFLPRSSRL